MDSIYTIDELNFLNELGTFFEQINQTNYWQDEEYDKIKNILFKYKPIIGDKERMITVYRKSFKPDLFDQWQEDIYMDILDRISGHSGYQNIIDLGA